MKLVQEEGGVSRQLPRLNTQHADVDDRGSRDTQVKSAKQSRHNHSRVPPKNLLFLYSNHSKLDAATCRDESLQQDKVRYVERT